MCGNPGNVPHVVCASEGDGITKSGGSGKVPIGRLEPRRGPGEEAREAKMEQTGASRGGPKSTGRLSIPIGQGVVERSPPPRAQAAGKSKGRRGGGQGEANVPWESAWRGERAHNSYDTISAQWAFQNPQSLLQSENP